MTPSPTHDSEDWLDEITVKLFNAGMSFANTKSFDYSPKDGKKAILAHYARPTKAQLELAAKVVTLEQKIYMMESTYLKPEDVEHYYDGCARKTENGFELGHKCSCGLEKDDKESIIGHVNYKLAQLSKHNREEKKDAKT